MLLGLTAAPALSQDTIPSQIPLRQDTCTAGRISFVYIDNNSIFDTSDPELDRRFLWAYRTANALHVRTRDWVIRRELLFGPGSCYDRYLLDETERLLRSYPFLSQVDVFEVRQPDGTYHVIVATRDEWSTRVDVRVNTRNGISLEGLRLTEDNILGSGQSVGAFYFEREVTRDYGLSYYAPQLFGTRWDLGAAAGRTRAGTFVENQIAYPFVGEVSRWAARQAFRRSDQFFNYVAADDPSLDADHVLLPLREQAFDLSVLRRIGDRGNTALVGAALSYQKLSYPGTLQVAPRGAFDERQPAPDSVALLARAQRQEIDNIRAFAMLGHRNVTWVRRRGLDSMRGQEDIRLGGEAVLALGRSMPSLEQDDDLYTMVGIYTGFDVGPALLIARARGDARRDLTASALAPEWEDTYLDAELLGYVQTPMLPRQTLFLRAAFLGAWHTRTPFQLTLGGPYGLRGYDDERFPGGRRLVVTAEDRFFIGWPLPDVLDLGGTVFVDAGRMWRGDAPFGVDSDWQASAGVGLRGSFPAGSRSSYRVDIAWPLQRGAGFSDFRLSVSIGEARGHSPREPDQQIVRSRTQNIGGDLFTFRN
jgi:transposase InsO family protein